MVFRSSHHSHRHHYWNCPRLSSNACLISEQQYTDLGATITGPQADLNLGITTYVNGVETNPVQIDTSQIATDTIDQRSLSRATRP